MIFKNDLHTWFPWPIWPTSCSKGAVRAFMLSNTQRSESLCRFVAPWKLDHWPKTEIWQWVNMANMANGQIFVSIASYRDNQCQYTLQDRGKVDCHISSTSTLLEELGNVATCHNCCCDFKIFKGPRRSRPTHHLKILAYYFDTSLHFTSEILTDFRMVSGCFRGAPRVP